ncbi:Putative intracellular protease/amidase [Streptosporangium subroseum]|uniref:Putative intracellular protease/amidase n=1 Tax=Streptosporangium subroseum TaxID=106412 RepID=A0A239F294_9ACTN|nr:type 1 glutamine amidotransferase domain-containing protein [Streptosporangium subroseum]SNS51009.1 Putative intracellular protease/amidase [Streptosporangium subroseum]
MSKILVVVTGTDHWTLADGTKHPTGFWAEELVAPYEIFHDARHEITLATPGGVVPTVDARSLSPQVNGGQENADRIARKLAEISQLQHPARLEDVGPEDLDAYDAVFYAGGHGPMEDLAVDAVSGRLLVAALASGKPLGIVCHGPAALLATASDDGRSPFAGYRATGFTNVEETRSGFADRAIWLLQDRLVALGIDFQEGEAFAPHVVVDRNLYTGQNPASSAPLANEMVKALAV